MAKDFFKVVRWALTVFLCIIIWKHAHWSVALAITMLSFSIEGIAAAIELHSRAIKAQLQDYKRLRPDLFGEEHEEA